jgi:hypothetical protein
MVAFSRGLMDDVVLSDYQDVFKWGLTASENFVVNC